MFKYLRFLGVYAFAVATVAGLLLGGAWMWLGFAATRLGGAARPHHGAAVPDSCDHARARGLSLRRDHAAGAVHGGPDRAVAPATGVGGDPGGGCSSNGRRARGAVRGREGLRRLCPGPQVTRCVRSIRCLSPSTQGQPRRFPIRHRASNTRGRYVAGASDPGPFPELGKADTRSGNGPGSDAPATGRPRVFDARCRIENRCG